MNEQKMLVEVFSKLWDAQYNENVKDATSDCIRFYRAAVTANPGDGTLTVQRAFSDPVNIPCVDYMKSATVDSQVVVALFGTGSRANSVVIGDGRMRLSILPRRYGATFSVADFVASGGNYVLTITAQTHGLGTSVDASVWRKNGTSYEKYNGYPNEGWKLAVDASGNVTLTVTSAANRFDGKIVLYSL